MFPWLIEDISPVREQYEKNLNGGITFFSFPMDSTLSLHTKFYFWDELAGRGDEIGIFFEGSLLHL